MAVFFNQSGCPGTGPWPAHLSPRWTPALWVLLAAVAGCGPGRAVVPGDPAARSVGLQLLRTEAQLARYPYFTLLSFETEADEVFVRSQGVSPQRVTDLWHTGEACLRLPAGTRRAEVKLEALHSGRSWPGPWTLIGAYFRTTAPQRLTAAFEAAGRVLESYHVELPAGPWTPVMLDIPAALAQGGADTIGSLTFTFDPPLERDLWLDDIVEIDNSTVLLQQGAVRLVEQGFTLTYQRPGLMRRFRTLEADPAGWRVVEANRLRIRLERPGGQCVILPDGRLLEDGRLTVGPDTPDAADVLANHEHPARVIVTGDAGQLVRHEAGDANNDGYNELAGHYTVQAQGARLELRIEPAGRLVRPLVLVRGLGPGSVLATLDGQLVERVVRLDDGAVLVELPGALTRPATLNLRAGG
jgi:hypothetical protein